MRVAVLVILFQSTLPRGSDFVLMYLGEFDDNFNPRSLAGATPYAAKLP